MEAREGWYTKHSFNDEFVDACKRIFKKYGEEIWRIQGIANSEMDVAVFSKSFFNKSGFVSDVSVDANANVREKNITQYNYECGKALMKLNSLYLMFKWVKKIAGLEVAELALEKVISGELFINDLVNFSMPYCYAFDLRTLLEKGMTFFSGNMRIGAPSRSDSFIDLLIQTTAYISNQIMGACSYPDLFPILDWFHRQELGDDYIKKMKKARQGKGPKKWIKEWYRIKNQFQNLIYSFNFPFRGNQSAFTNVSVMDRGFAKELFGEYVFPDFTSPDIESTVELSKIFFEYFAKINGKEGMFTFPVITMAISLDEKTGEYMDPDFVDWCAEANAAKSLANIFQSPPNAFSSCCRMLNNFDGVAEQGYQNSFGVGGLSIGSHRVAGLNLPRIALLEDSNPNLLKEDLELLHKILRAHRKLIQDKIDRGYLPLYSPGWIELNRQYSTIGFVGAYEYLKNKGLEVESEEGLEALKTVLRTIEDKIKQWQIREKGRGYIYNIEQIPAESMAVRLASVDAELGMNPHRFKLYSNQYIPLIQKSSIFDRFRIQGEIDKFTSGGAILHLNVDDEKPLTTRQFRRLLQVAKDTGTVYFAVNYAYSECANGHYIVGKHERCCVCQAPIVTQYTRVVGFITPVNSWNPVRKNFEYGARVFYGRKEVAHAHN